MRRLRNRTRQGHKQRPTPPLTGLTSIEVMGA